jgi:putative sterol carrier protein
VGDPTEEFFDQLARRRHEPVLEEIAGTIRFDLRDDGGLDQWLVVIKDGDVSVSREAPPAPDCIVHTTRDVFNQMATGQLHPLPAWLRNLYWMEGNAVLFRLFNRVLPGPAQARHPRDLVEYGRRRR